MKKTGNYFGTDGIRGLVGSPPITVEFIMKLGWAVGRVLSMHKDAKVVIGKDTRISGYMIESALQSGLSAAGTQVLLLGPMPTSAIAYFTRTLRANMGIVISASHNPYEDNGIKFFSAEGYKLPTEIEKEIEEQLGEPIQTVNSKLLGKAKRIDDAAGRYIEYCKSSLPHKTDLMNLKIVIDCANGATYHIAPDVFSELGANVIPIHNTPNGININSHCGSTHPDVLKRAVLSKKADLGIAFDGDGDRVIMVDHLGEIVDGDEIIYVITKELLACNNFSGGIVGTYMSNIGLEIALKDLRIPFVRVAVGDQHVIREMLERGWILGGEPSGHITYSTVNTTGDGIIAALQVLNAMIHKRKTLNELKKGMKKFPQKIVNIPYLKNKIDLEQSDIKSVIKNAETRLGKTGRILVRYSGTEPVIRIMVEAETPDQVDEVISELKSVIQDKINGR